MKDSVKALIVAVASTFVIVLVVVFSVNRRDKTADGIETLSMDTSTFMQHYTDLNGWQKDKFTVLDVYMRQENTFLQGLFYDDEEDLFGESSGLYKKSKVRYLKLDKKTKALKYDQSGRQFFFDDDLFAEGLCPLNDDQLIALTWKSGKVYVLDKDSLQVEQQLSLFDGAQEGWGISVDMKKGLLYVTDGSSEIQVVDAKTFKTVRSMTVTDENGSPVDMLNEIEFVNGLIYANIWFSNDIIAIDSTTGKVEKRWDMSNLKRAERNFQQTTKGSVSSNVLNGIAYSAKSDTFFVTGKLWHLMYQVKFDGQ